jgi:hypothetical protein
MEYWNIGILELKEQNWNTGKMEQWTERRNIGIMEQWNIGKKEKGNEENKTVFML